MKAHSIPISAWISLAFWISLAGLRLHEAWQNAHLIPALLAAQSGLIAWLLITRSQQAMETGWLQKIVAWASAFLPLALRIHHETLVGQGITSLGLLLVLWTMGTLGRSFGIAPADRGLVMNWPLPLHPPPDVPGRADFPGWRGNRRSFQREPHSDPSFSSDPAAAYTLGRAGCIQLWELCQAGALAVDPWRLVIKFLNQCIFRMRTYKKK